MQRVNGENYYCLIDDIRFTIHANSYTMITANKMAMDKQVLKGVQANTL